MFRHKIVGLALYLLFGSVGMILAQAAQFLEAPQYATGTNPQAVATGDFNGDGNLDLAVANSTSNTVSVLLGKGNGTFGPKVDYAVGSTPKGIAVGQFRGSGHPFDLAVTNSLDNTVSILLGNGDGTFQAQAVYKTGTKPIGVAVGDFGNGNLDLVVTNSDDNNVGVLIGNGDGTFKTMVTYRTGVNPTSVAVGDLTGSGILDLVVANNNNNDVLSILLGNGDVNGTFQGQLQAGTGNTPIWVALGDFNGDGILDIAVANEMGNTVSILLGQGNGGFQTHVDYPTALFPTSVAVGDFTGSGTLDLAVSSGNGNSVTVLWGKGDGTFPTQNNIGTGDIPYSVITGDFNNDGKTDLVVANSGGNPGTVSVILNDGGQAFQDREDYPAAGIQPYSIVTADFNGDGFLDLAVAISNCAVFPNCGPGGVSIMLGNGDGTFQTPTSLYSTGTNTDPDSIVVGDFNGDGIPDLAVANYATGTVSVLLGNGDGTFQGHIDSTVGSEPASVAAGDFNGDGKLDLAVANFHDNTVSVLIGNGNGTFKSQVTYNVGHGPVSVAVGDFTGTGILDLVVINETDNNASVLLGNGDGTFQAQKEYPIVAGGNPLSVAVADFTGSGVLDLAVADYQKQEVSILLGDGKGGFGTATQYSTGANPSSVFIADFNGDGKPDLALTSTPLGSAPGNVVSVLLGNGDGTFGTAALFGTGSQAYSAAVGPFSQDGTADIAVANGISNTVSVLLNTQGTHIGLTSSANPSFQGQSVTFTATVAASLIGMPAPTGTVTVKNGSTVLGSGALVDGSYAVSTTALPAGSDTISAVYSGDSNFQPHTVSLTQTVQAVNSTTTVLNASSNSPSLTLTATVSSGAGTPTGSVTFMDGANSLGSTPVNGSGVAALSSLTSLPAGTQNITAVYTPSQGSGFAGSTSSVVPVSVGFALTDVALAPSSIAPGSSASSTITITPSNGFNPAGVTFTCSITPAVTPAPTCTLGTITVANDVGTATVTFGTTANTKALAAGFMEHRPGALLAFGLLIPALLLGTGRLSKQQRQKMVVCCLAVLVLGGCLFQAACGGGNNSTSTPPPSGGTPAGTYTVTVTGSSGSVSGVQAPAMTVSVQ